MLSFSSIRRKMLLKLIESAESRLPRRGLGDYSPRLLPSASAGRVELCASSQIERKGLWAFNNSMALVLASDPSLPQQRSSFTLSDSTFLRMVEFQWFLMQLSVLPGSSRVSLAHLPPRTVWARKSSHSYSAVQSARLMAGLRWLYHRSRHCFPNRPGMFLAICDHLFAPHRPTAAIRSSSSSYVQDRLGKRRLWMNDWGGLKCDCGEFICFWSIGIA